MDKREPTDAEILHLLAMAKEERKETPDRKRLVVAIMFLVVFVILIIAAYILAENAQNHLPVPTATPTPTVLLETP